MKVCIIAGREFFFPFDQRVYKEAKALSNAGFEVTLVTPDPDERRTDVDDISVITVSTRTRGTTAKKLVKVLRKLDCDVYHAHEYDGGYVGATLKLLTGRPVFYDVHDDVPGLLADIKGNPKLERVYDTIERRMIKAMKGLVLAADSLVPRYSKLHKNTVVINNYPMLELFQECKQKQVNSTDPDILELAERTTGKFTLGYVGGISRRRGILSMLEIMKELEKEKNINLLLIGNFDRAKDEKEALGYIAEHNLKDRIIFKPWVDYKKLPAYLYLINAGLVIFEPLSWLKDVVPTKIYDYMACGKPVIASKLPGIEKMVSSATCGILVEPGDTAGLAEAVRNLAGSPELADKLGKNGYDAARSKYNWDIEAVKLVGFYKDNLG